MGQHIYTTDETKAAVKKLNRHLKSRGLSLSEWFARQVERELTQEQGAAEEMLRREAGRR